MKLELPLAWKPLRPHPIQSALWRCNVRFPVVAAGRGSGKTEIALRRLALCGRVSNGRYFYAGPTIQQAKSVAWERLIALVPPQWLVPGSPNRSELTIKTIFGCEIRVAGLDKPHRLEGVQYNGGILDEGADIRPGAFSKSILPALSTHRGWLWRLGVPKRVGIGIREYKEAFDRGNDVSQWKVTKSFTWPSSDILDEDILEEAKSQLDEVTYNEQFNATWESVAGGIYYAFNEKVNVKPCLYDSSKEICVGSDFNVDPMSWCLGHNYKGGIEIFDEIRLRDANTPGTLDQLYKKYGTHKCGWKFYGDATGRSRKTSASRSDYQIIANDERFNPKRVLYPASNPQHKDRFAATNAMLKNAKGVSRIFIDPRCKHLIDDLKCRSYVEGTSEPDDGADIGHMADAFDYFVYAEYPIGWDKILRKAPKVGL